MDHDSTQPGVNPQAPHTTETAATRSGIAGMFGDESVANIILYYAGKAGGIGHRRLDFLFSTHHRGDVHQTGELLAVIRHLREAGMIAYGGPHSHYVKGPRWEQPDFVKNNTYAL